MTTTATTTTMALMNNDSKQNNSSSISSSLLRDGNAAAVAAGSHQMNAVIVRSNNERVVLPPGWNMSYDEDGNEFYIDHNTRTTQWELPLGSYSITNSDHNNPSQCNASWSEAGNFAFDRDQRSSLSDCENGASSRFEFYHPSTPSLTSIEEAGDKPSELEKIRQKQTKMLLKFLLAVHDDFESKNELRKTLKKRLDLAGTESESLKQLLSSSVTTTPPTTPDESSTKKVVGAASSSSGSKAAVTEHCKSNFDISSLTKQYLDSQKRVQSLREELSSRSPSHEFSLDDSLRRLLLEHNSPYVASTSTYPNADYYTTSLTDQSLASSSSSSSNDNLSLLQQKAISLQKCIDHLKIRLAPLQPHLDHHRLSVIQEKENLLNEMMQWNDKFEMVTDNPKEAQCCSTAVSHSSQSSIEALREEILNEKQLCNAIINQRLSLFEQKYKLETEYANIYQQIQKLKRGKINRNTQDQEPCNSSPRDQVRQTNQYSSSSQSADKNLPLYGNIGSGNIAVVDSEGTVFVSDVSPEVEVLASGPDHSRKISPSVGQLKHIRRSESCHQPLLEKGELLRDKNESDSCLYENFPTLAVVDTPLHQYKVSEEHNCKLSESYYELVYEDQDHSKQPQHLSPRHAHEDSGVAFYENVKSSASAKDVSLPCFNDAPKGVLPNYEMKNLSLDSSSGTAPLKCKILIDIKFTRDHQLHVRLEELKDLCLLQSLSGIQFSVELYSLDDNSSTCQCTSFLTPKDFDVGGKVIVINEFMAFDLPNRGSIDSLFLRVIMFCRPRPTSNSLPENFLAEIDMNLLSVYFGQRKSKSPTTSHWYQFSMAESTQLAEKSPSLGYSSDYGIGFARHLQTDSRTSASERQPIYTSYGDEFAFGPTAAYPTAFYSVKNATMARLQYLNECPPYFGGGELVSNDNFGYNSNLDEGYDERGVDCDLGSGTNSFRRSATFSQSSRNYSSFNAHTNIGSSQQQTCKLNRSESDSATQHYMAKPKVVGGAVMGPSSTCNESSSKQSSTGTGVPSTSLGSRFTRNAVERIPSRIKQKIKPVKHNSNSPASSSRFACASPINSHTQNVSPSSSPSLVSNLAANVKRKLTSNNISNL